jgi:hypothetical protein
VYKQGKEALQQLLSEKGTKDEIEDVLEEIRDLIAENEEIGEALSSGFPSFFFLSCFEFPSLFFHFFFSFDFHDLLLHSLGFVDLDDPELEGELEEISQPQSKQNEEKQRENTSKTEKKKETEKKRETEMREEGKTEKKREKEKEREEAEPKKEKKQERQPMLA